MAEEKDRFKKLRNKVAYRLYLDGEDLFKEGKRNEAFNYVSRAYTHFNDNGNNYGASLCEDLLRKERIDPILLESNHEKNREYMKNLEKMLKEIYTVSAN
jgi:N-glycosylase/DNA lyase